MTTSRLASLALCVLLTGLLRTAAAQVVDGPPGSNRGIFGETGGIGAPALSMTFDLEGGYDANDLSQSNVPSGQFGPFQSGYVTSVGASLRYQRGRAERFFIGTGSGSVNHQQLARGQEFYRLTQGDLTLQAATTLGRRSGLTVAAGSSYVPTFVFGAFDSLGRNTEVASPLDEVPSPTADPTLSLTAQRWLTGRASAGFYRNWTSRQRMSVDYAGLWFQPVSGPGFESRTDTVALLHSWNPRPTGGVELAYRYNRNVQSFEGAPAQPLDMHSAEGRVRLDRRLSPNRSLSFMVGAGVVGVGARAAAQGSAFGGVLPTVSGSVQLRFLPTWGLLLSARRDITVLNGLSAEPFESNAAALTIDGTAWRRLTVGVTGGYSQGRARSAQGGDFDQTLLNAELQYGFSARLGLVVAYSYTQHSFRNVPVASPSFPTQFGRNSVRVGLTMWLPLYGTF